MQNVEDCKTTVKLELGLRDGEELKMNISLSGNISAYFEVFFFFNRFFLHELLREFEVSGEKKLNVEHFFTKGK